MRDYQERLYDEAEAIQEDRNKEVKDNKPTVKLVGEDGNAFAILSIVTKALRKAGLGDQVEEYTTKATQGDYDHLLQVTMEFVNVE